MDEDEKPVPDDTETEPDAASDTDAEDGGEAVSELADVLAAIAVLDAKVDSITDSIANFRETVAAMKVDSGAVVRDGDTDATDIEVVSQVPDPRERDYTL